jgi:hypothetical protein
MPTTKKTKMCVRVVTSTRLNLRLLFLDERGEPKWDFHMGWIESETKEDQLALVKRYQIYTEFEII